MISMHWSSTLFIVLVMIPLSIALCPTVLLEKRASKSIRILLFSLHPIHCMLLPEVLPTPSVLVLPRFLCCLLHFHYWRYLQVLFTSPPLCCHSPIVAHTKLIFPLLVGRFFTFADIIQSSDLPDTWILQSFVRGRFSRHSFCSWSDSGKIRPVDFWPLQPCPQPNGCFTVSSIAKTLASVLQNSLR